MWPSTSGDRLNFTGLQPRAPAAHRRRYRVSVLIRGGHSFESHKTAPGRPDLKAPMSLCKMRINASLKALMVSIRGHAPDCHLVKTEGALPASRLNAVSVIPLALATSFNSCAFQIIQR